MPRTLLLAALVLAASRGAFAAPRPVAHWDVVPFQRISEPFKAGVVAFAGKVGGTKVSGSSQLICGGFGATVLSDVWYMTLYAPPKGAFTGWSETFGVVLGTDANHAVTGVTLTRLNPQD